MSLDTIGITSTIVTILSSLISVGGKVQVNGSVEEVNEEISKRDISLELVKQQARAAQELAIALRIETADEVEIEEFYDNSGDGNAGLKATNKDISLGISGSGRRITKRIYKFKGHNGEKIEVYNQKLSEILDSKIQNNNEEDKKSF